MIKNEGYNMEKVLITGGAGYVGSHTVKELIKQGYSVVVYDNLSRGKKYLIDKRASFVQGDVGDRKKLDEVFKKYGVTAVIHFANFAYVDESIKNPQMYYLNNVAKGLCLLRSMINNKVTKIIFSSSNVVYGEPKKIPISEKDELKPINPYGQTKLFFERILEDYEKSYGLKYISLRYFNACGASLDSSIGEDHDPEKRIIPILIETALGIRKSFNLFGKDYKTKDGTCIRDYTHVLDLAEAHILALRRLERDNKSNVYNVGSGRGYSIIQLIKEVEKFSKKKINFSIAGRREGDPSILVADNKKIKTELGWEPRHSDIKTIIASAWAWHQKKNGKI